MPAEGIFALYSSTSRIGSTMVYIEYFWKHLPQAVHTCCTFHIEPRPSAQGLVVGLVPRYYDIPAGLLQSAARSETGFGISGQEFLHKQYCCIIIAKSQYTRISGYWYLKNIFNKKTVDVRLRNPSNGASRQLPHACNLQLIALPNMGIGNTWPPGSWQFTFYSG